MGRPPVSLGLAQRRVTDLLSKSTILGSPGAEGGPGTRCFKIHARSLIFHFSEGSVFLELLSKSIAYCMGFLPEWDRSSREAQTGLLY